MVSPSSETLQSKPHASGRRIVEVVVVDNSEDIVMIDDGDTSKPDADIEVVDVDALDYPVRFSNSQVCSVHYCGRTVVVEERDLNRVQDVGLHVDLKTRYINDALLEFYLAKTWQSLPSARQQSTYIFSAFFSAILQTTSPGGSREVNKASKLITKFKIHTHEFAVCPFLRHAHWFAIIVVNPRAVVRGQTTDSADRILPASLRGRCVLYVLDSILEDRTAEANLLLAALEKSAEEVMAKNPGALAGAVIRHIAVRKQPNSVDCGFHVAHNVRRFLHNPKMATMLAEGGAGIGDGCFASKAQGSKDFWGWEGPSLRHSYRNVLYNDVPLYFTPPDVL